MTARRCAVIGGGIAGASVAASLARRGWQVQVLDAAAQPAAGASGLPVGLFAPHVSPDDAILSRLTRAGVQATLQQAGALLQRGDDWDASGVLEHGVKGARRMPVIDTGSRPATASERAAAGLDADAPALWHTHAGWLKPARLVQALLSQPGIEWRGLCAVACLQRHADGWYVQDEHGQRLAEAPLVVVAAGPHSAALLGGRLPLQPLRGQIAWGHCGDAHLPPFPVNGHGSLVAGIPHEGGPRGLWALPLSAPALTRRCALANMRTTWRACSCCCRRQRASWRDSSLTALALAECGAGPAYAPPCPTACPRWGRWTKQAHLACGPAPAWGRAG
jgi:tRNA 5-methylaminomethyl-2-thiouridine biosynthesis bifunctional protein